MLLNKKNVCHPPLNWKKVINESCTDIICISVQRKMSNTGLVLHIYFT